MDSNCIGDNSHIRIAQFNIQSANSKKALLIKFLNEQSIDICLLNETWFKNNNSFKVPGYDIYNRNSKNSHNGVAIIIRKTLKYKTLNTIFYEDIQTVALSLSTDYGNLTVLCVYCPPNSGHIRIRKLRNVVRDLPKPIFISGDFNAHHVAFGCMSTKGRGQELYNLIDENDLCILNNGNFTTVNRPTQNPSAIDVTFVSPCIAPLCEWSVHDDCMGSYHYPTITQIQMRIEKYQINEPIDRYLYKKTDWIQYKKLSQQLFENIVLDQYDPINSYNQFCNKLEILKQQCIPKFTKLSKYRSRPPCPWWNDKCEQSVIKSYELLKHYRANPTMENYINYKKADALKKRTLAEQKHNSWDNLCNTFNRTTPISRIWNLIKMFRGAKSKSKSYNDEFMPQFLNKLSDSTNLITDDLQSYFSQNNNDSNSKFLLEPFTWSEFTMSLNSRRDTTPGLDDFPYILIKKLDDIAQKIFLNVFNNLWSKLLIPDSWKTQCVIPILKPDKSPDCADSYRPISLASCLGKIFEAMIKVRLDWYIEANKIIPDVQYGFRRGRSCTDSFLSLISDLKRGKNTGLSTVCTFLDIQGAFDSIDPGILVKILTNFKIPGMLCQWIYSFLNNRTLYVKHNNILHGPRTVSKGTMQGSILSPLLFNLYVCEILQYVNIENVNILQFADDIILYSSHSSLDSAINNINKALDQLNFYYSNRLHLKVNTSKSHTMLFSKDEPHLQVKYDGTAIPIVHTHKFLGIILDKKLTFEPHIKHIIAKSMAGLNIMRCMAGVSWGADPKTLAMLYKAIVRSHFDYSTLAYVNSVHVNKLNIIQNKALRIISGAMCSTPIRAMEVETKILPLHLRRQKIIKRFILKLLSSDNKFIIQKITYHMNSHLPSALVQDITQYQNIYKQDGSWSCYAHPYRNTIHPVSVINELISDNKDFLNFLSQYGNAYRIYTDGSKGENYCRSAIYDPQTGYSRSFTIHNVCSIFTAEAYAIFEALKLLKTNNPSLKRILILTDSLSVIQAIQNLKFNYKTNYLLYAIKSLIISLEDSDTHISLMWIPSHKGITGNEIADKVAYEGRNSLDVRHMLWVPMTDYYSVINVEILNSWKAFWKHDQEEEGKGQWYGSIQEDIPNSPWYNSRLRIASRNFITTINRLRFGHNCTPSHLSRLNIGTNTCDYCKNAVGDVEHLIFDCPSFNIQRLIFASEVIEIGKSDFSSRRRLIDLLKNPECYPPLYKFVKKTVNKI